MKNPSNSENQVMLERFKEALDKAESLEQINDLIKYIAKNPDDNFGRWIREVSDEKIDKSNRKYEVDYEVSSEVLHEEIVKRICALANIDYSNYKDNEHPEYMDILGIDNVKDFLKKSSDYVAEKDINEKKALNNILLILHQLRSNIMNIKEYRSESLKETQKITSLIAIEIVEDEFKNKPPVLIGGKRHLLWEGKIIEDEPVDMKVETTSRKETVKKSKQNKRKAKTRAWVYGKMPKKKGNKEQYAKTTDTLSSSDSFVRVPLEDEDKSTAKKENGTVKDNMNASKVPNTVISLDKNDKEYAQKFLKGLKDFKKKQGLIEKDEGGSR